MKIPIKKSVRKKKRCWCYSGEITLCGECDREFIMIGIATYRKIDPKIRKILDEVKNREKLRRREDSPCS